MAIRSKTLVGFLLQMIREGTEIGHFPTEPELLEKIQISLPWRRYRYLFELNELDELDGLRSILEEFRDLGLIKLAPNQEDSGFPQWEVGDGWKPPRDGGDRVPPNPPEQNAGGPDDGDGGGGMREVISHPLLFALDTDDFEELVDNLFSEDDQNDR